MKSKIAFLIIIAGLLTIFACENSLIEQLWKPDEETATPEISLDEAESPLGVSESPLGVPGDATEIPSDITYAVTGVSLNQKELTLPVGKTDTLVATVLPHNATNKAVTWTSSDDLIATVEDGFVTVLADGIATITVTTDDGNYSETCTITVKESTGKADAPFLIYNETELRQVGTGLDGWDRYAHYKLMVNITLNTEWRRIGHISDASVYHFFGSFNGNNKTITGLSIDKPTLDSQGMFGYIGIGGEVNNLNLVNCNVYGKGNTGGLAGQNEGTVENCYVTGVLIGTGGYLGGVVGRNTGGTITNCNAEVNVSISGTGTGGLVGGVVGTNSGIVENSHATGDVSGKDTVGGVVGNNSGTVENCYATGNVSGNSSVGGVVGNNLTTVENCYATGNVSGNARVGGVVGSNTTAGDRYGTVVNCYATGDVRGTGGLVGGVTGTSDGKTVEMCYATGNVSGASNVGGVTGSNSCPVVNCYATGDVSGNGSNVGGVTGGSSSTVENCYATGDVSGTGDYIGGVAGRTHGTVKNCYSTGNVSGAGDYIGGVAGRNSVSGANKDPLVENCYATGNVSGKDYVGGVLGQNLGAVRNCVALNPNITGGVSENNRRIGCGNGTLLNNYAWKDMGYNNSIGTWISNAYGIDGEDITSANYNLQSWWSGSVGFNFSTTGVWEWHSASQLPVLKTVRP